VHQNLAEI